MSEVIHNLSAHCPYRKAKRPHRNNRVIRVQRAKPNLKTKSVTRTALLAALGGILAVPGAGHLFLGHTIKGLITLALGWAIIAAGAGLYLSGLAEFDFLSFAPGKSTIIAGMAVAVAAALVYLWQLFDAVAAAILWNRYVAQRYNQLSNQPPVNKNSGPLRYSAQF